MSGAGIAGGMMTAIDSFRPSLVARSTGHQAVLFGISSSIGYIVGRSARRTLDVFGVRELLPPKAEAVLFAAAAAAAVPVIVHRSGQEREAHASWGTKPMHAGVAAAQGTAIAVGLVGGANLVGKGVSTAAGAASERIGGPQAAWTAAGAAAVAGAAAGAAPQVRRVLFDKLGTAGTTPDPAFAQPPENPFVSGGPGSLIGYGSHAREGSRLVHLARTADSIAAVTGRPAKDPIRVFVGVSAKSTPSERVDLAIAELQRLGAFERSAILAISPAGTGYANPVPAESLELMTSGDCATVVIQYGVLPSMFSSSVVPVGAETYRLLLDALAGRGPRIFAYGESLGAQCAQIALLSEPSRWQPDGSFDGVSACLFVGTPAGTGIRRMGAPDRPAVLLADQWQDLPPAVPDGVSVFLLDHDADPVTRFESRLIWSRPDWLAQHPRGRGVPKAMAWRPLLTYLQVGFDVARATQSQVGDFQSHGHDYRADLAQLVRAAFAPAVPAEFLDVVHEELVSSEQRRTQLLAQK
jgi:uncharacterized membrane protein